MRLIGLRAESIQLSVVKTMVNHIDIIVFKAMLTAAALRLRRGQALLSELDAATGDGDHGSAMVKVAGVFDSICSSYESSEDLAEFLEMLGWAVMGTDSGSTGPLFGTLFLGMGEGIEKGQIVLYPLDFVKILEAGLVKMQSMTKAKPGDKTLIDALVPAVAACRTAAESGGILADVINAGAAAAEEGAAATKDMQALFGRAKNIGTRSIGHIDPGAVSMSLLFAGFAEGLAHA